MEKTKCERRKINDRADEWICVYCGSLWWSDLIGEDWRPLGCPERTVNMAQSMRNQE